MRHFIAFMITMCIVANEQPYAVEGDQLYRCIVPGIGSNTRFGGLYEKTNPPKQELKSEKDIELYYKKKMADMKLAHEQALQDRDQLAMEKESKNKATAMKWGNILFFGGLALFVVGLFVACLLKQYRAETFGVAIMAFGGLGLSVGAVLIGAVKHYEATVYTVIGLVVSFGLVMLFHGKGIDVKLPRKLRNRTKRKIA